MTIELSLLKKWKLNKYRDRPISGISVATSDKSLFSSLPLLYLRKVS